jgi:Ca2+-binding RTX toxin-like protein
VKKVIPILFATCFIWLAMVASAGAATINCPYDGDTSDGHCRGTAGEDWMYGTSGANIMHGNGGKDHMFGYGGADEMYGDGDVDDLFGGVGNDFLNGGTSADNLHPEEGSDRTYGSDGGDYIRADGDAGFTDSVYGGNPTSGSLSTVDRCYANVADILTGCEYTERY